MTTTPVAEFERPSPELLERLGRTGTAVVGDAMERFGVLDSGIQARWAGARVVGSAFTVLTREGDNLAVHEALETTGPGDVLVVNGQGSTTRALIGEMLAIKARARGLAGFVLDGAARDIEEIEALGVPVFARGQTPAGPFKSGPYRLLEPVAVGGVVVRPGDAIIGDRDGVVAVPREHLSTILEKAQSIIDNEVVKRVRNAEPIR